jgi:hypothetical protein
MKVEAPHFIDVYLLSVFLHVYAAAGTVGTAEGRAAWLSLPSKLPQLRVIGLGVTEAGIAPKSQVLEPQRHFHSVLA